MSFSRRILALVIGIICIAVTGEIVSQQSKNRTDLVGEYCNDQDEDDDR